MIINYTAHGRTAEDIERDTIRIGHSFYGDAEWTYVLRDCYADDTEVLHTPDSAETRVTLWQAEVTAGPIEELRQAVIL